jgi:hypothetical protein
VVGKTKPENYSNVYYRIEPTGKQTILTITQDNNTDEKSRDHSQATGIWCSRVLKKLLKIRAVSSCLSASAILFQVHQP